MLGNNLLEKWNIKAIIIKNEILANSISWLIALLILVLPLAYLLYTGDNLFLSNILMFWSCVVYAFITIQCGVYFGGAVKCSKRVASVISNEIRSEIKWTTSIIPFYLSTIAVCLIVYKSNYTLAIVVITPVIITKISNHILHYKAKA